MCKMMKWAMLNRFAAGTLLASAFACGTAGAQQNPNQFDAKPQINVEDKDDVTKAESKVWVLNLKFQEPRLITVDIPGRGRRLCWYLRYEVINNTKEPRIFHPQFELVTIDMPGKVFHDQILPKAQEAIQQQDDPL